MTRTESTAAEGSTCSDWRRCRHAACRDARARRDADGRPDPRGPALAHDFGEPCSCADCIGPGARPSTAAEYLAEYLPLAPTIGAACMTLGRAADATAYACARVLGHPGAHYGAAGGRPVRLSVPAAGVRHDGIGWTATRADGAAERFATFELASAYLTGARPPIVAAVALLAPPMA